MKVVGFAGYSGSGKTTLVERLIPILRSHGQRVSVVKHAHHRFDIDHAGKDTFRHREAGAFEVVVASDKRLALMREFEQPMVLSVHQLIAELYDGVDWVLVEGFKDSDLLKIEVWRNLPDQPVRYPHDDFIVAIATDSPQQLPQRTLRPVFDLNHPEALVHWLLANADRFDYRAENFE
jgi:molybdopterin-guanine dinucleotide biosynthesis protein B